MGRRRAIALGPVMLLVAILAACSSKSGGEEAGATGDDATITVGSFDFAENHLLAEIYSQALEAGGFVVRRAYGLGPREFVAPALTGGMVDLVPEYAGTALQFLSLGQATPGAGLAETHEALTRTARGSGLTPLRSAPAEDANAFVVTRVTAARHGLRLLSDVAPVAGELTFGGPPECFSRPLCLGGLQRVYGLSFPEVVPLDAGGPLTRQALREGQVDVALLFTTDPALAGGDFVELVDDRGLQPPENVTPLVRTEVVERWGARLVDLVDTVSARLTTDDLRALNSRVADGGEVAAVASAWLRAGAPVGAR